MKLKIPILMLLILSLFAACSSTHSESTDEEIDSYSIAETSETIVNPELPSEITVNGEAVTIEQETLLQPGDLLADAALIKTTSTFDTMESVSFSSYTGYKVIHIVPSLDTPVCSLQTRILNNAAAEFSDVTFITISQDLPFALERFATNNNILTMTLLSDYQNHDFAISNGLYMPYYHLNLRAVIIVDETNTVQYVEYVPEVTNEINISNVINFLRQNKK